MKIEMCEQMMQSWLLNCKLCEIAQTNWKMSPLYLKTISVADVSYVQQFMDEIKSIPHEGMQDVFGNNDAKQFIRQCEIDIVGVKFDEGDVDTVYCADSAFHKDGLNYSDTTKAVTMKIARAAAMSHIVFGAKATTKVIFVSPRCKQTPEQKVVSAVNAILPTVKKYYPNVVVELYFNKDFAEKIYLPLVNNIDELYDDNDLFMRALYLEKIAMGCLSNESDEKSTTKKINKVARKQTGNSFVTPTITFNPANVDAFKQQLLQTRRAEITWIYGDGTQVDKVWDATKVSATTDVKMNIQSRPEWRNREANGLVEVKVKLI